MNKVWLLSLILLLVVDGTSSAQQKSDTWRIEADSINPSKYFGETVGNGMIGVVSSPYPFKVKDIILNGAFDAYGRGRVSNILNTLSFLNLYFNIDYERIESFSQVQHVKQTLDMQRGCFTVSFDYYDKASVTYTYYALRHLPYTCLVDVAVTANQDIEISPSSVIETPDNLRDPQNTHHEISSPKGSISLLTTTAKSPTGKLLLAASNSFLFDDQENRPTVVHQVWDNNMHLIAFTKKLKTGETFHFALAGTSLSSVHTADPLNETERLTLFAALEGREKLIAFHNQAWADLWKSDIVIEGDDVTQRHVRSMVYHLYASVREGTDFGLSPMGLTGFGYNGHTFWDNEIWMYPALLALQPQLAKSLIRYRFNRLEQAKENAAAHGYKGAMYPWESAGSGYEETPVWALSGPFEHHITADVAIAAWNYYCVSQDKSWLREVGYPILRETALFWTSRVERNGPGRYDIKNVVAADEWAENVDNNAFTNAAAKANLLYATEAAKVIGAVPDPDWMLVYKNIPILKLENGVTREHATYNGEKIKQADVNLLAYPLKEITDPSAIRKDIEYYETRVGDGPAMTHAIFSILYSKLEMPDKAFDAFQAGYMRNRRPPFGVLAETATGNNTYFVTGAGGMVQAVLFGFGGLEITPQGIVQHAVPLPAAWKSLRITGVRVNRK